VGRRLGEVGAAGHGDAQLIAGVEELLAVEDFVAVGERLHDAGSRAVRPLSAERQHHDRGPACGDRGNVEDAERTADRDEEGKPHLAELYQVRAPLRHLRWCVGNEAAMMPRFLAGAYHDTS
jgi:hypothetical protein